MGRDEEGELEEEGSGGTNRGAENEQTVWHEGGKGASIDSDRRAVI